MNKLYIKLIIACFGLLVWSCDEDTSPGPIPPTGNMVINLSNLEVLPSGWIYEGWIIVGGEAMSTGEIEVDSDGNLKNSTIPVESANLESANKFVVTIESTTDNDPAPSNVKVLSGDFTQYEAVLSTDGENAIGSNLDASSFSGKFLINAPTTATSDDDTSGVWFIDNSSGSNAAGLNLPILNTGWIYEGWAIINGTVVSTGRFTSASASDESCNYCGPLAAPSYPGEDFVANAPSGLNFPTILADERVVISIEPQPDYSNAPSNIKILDGIIPSIGVLEIGKSYNMTNLTVVIPSGKIDRFYGFDCTNNGCL